MEKKQIPQPGRKATTTEALANINKKYGGALQQLADSEDTDKLHALIKSLSLQQLRGLETICTDQTINELLLPAIVTEKNSRDNTMPAVYVTVWDDVGEIRTKCEFNDAKMTVKNIEQVDMELNGVCEREFIELPDSRTFDTFFNEDTGTQHEPDNADVDEFVNHRLKPNGEMM